MQLVPGPTDVQDFGFDPRAIGSLVLWNDASTYTGALSGGTWSNRSLNPRFTMTYTGTPTYISAATAGLRFGVFQFATTDAQKVTPDPVLSTAMTFFFVTRKASGNGRVFQAASGGSNILYGYWNVFKDQLFISAWLVGNGVTGTALDNAWDIYTVRIAENGTYTFYNRGNFLGSNATSVTLPAMNGLGTNSLGNFNEPSQYQIAETLLYDTNLSFNDARAVEGYLAWKWGIQANLATTHPFFSNAPKMTLFTPDKFQITPRIWYDFADNTCYQRINAGKIEIFRTKGSGRISASYWSNATNTIRGNTAFLPSFAASSLNNYSTALYTNNQGLWTSSIGCASNARCHFWCFQATSNLSTAYTGLINPIPNTEFFMPVFENTAATSAGGASMVMDKTVGATQGTIYAFNSGPSGIQTNVAAPVGRATGANNTYPLQTGWVILGGVDNFNSFPNGNRVTCYNACNVGRFSQYFTGTQLNQNLTNAFYNQNPLHGFLGIPYSLNNAWHVGIEVAETVFFDAYMTNNDSLKVDGYLGWKWGLQGNFSTTFAFARIPPVMPTGFNGTRSNYFGTAQAVTYLPLQSNLLDIGTYPQLVMSNGTGMAFGAVGGKTGIQFPNGLANYLSLSNQFQPDMTICFWAYQNNTTYYTCVSFAEAALALPVIQFDTNNNQLVFMATANAANQMWTSATATVGTTATTWYSVALVCSSNVGTLYINGTNTATLNGALPLHSRGTQFVLGRSGDAGRAFSGYLRHFTLFNRALSATEVSSWHTNTTN